MDKSPTYPIGIGIAPTKKVWDMGHQRFSAHGSSPSEGAPVATWPPCHRATARRRVFFEPKAAMLQGFTKVPAESTD